MPDSIRLAEPEDLPRITEIYAGARAFMAANGNPEQWGTSYPSRQQLLQDIRSRVLYLLEDDRGIHGVFAFLLGKDPTYQVIYDGAWHYDLPYGTIHRVAGDGSGGIFSAIVTFARKRCPYLRIDTHTCNRPMRRAIQRAGFRPCGTILTQDGSPRLAFDLCLLGAIRQARKEDVSRLAEILVFSKRMHFYPIFQDADFSFQQLQVVPLARQYLENPQWLEETWVYEDGIVKGLVRISGREVRQLYAEPFFSGQGIGGALLEFAKAKGACALWALEDNTRGRAFYRRHGFRETNVWAYEDGTDKRLLRMELRP